MITSAVPLDGPNTTPAARFYSHQKGVQETTWTEAEAVPSRTFSWKAHAPGAFLTARHRLEPHGRNAVAASLESRMSGALGRTAGLLKKGKAERRTKAGAKRGAGRAA